MTDDLELILKDPAMRASLAAFIRTEVAPKYAHDIAVEAEVVARDKAAAAAAADVQARYAAATDRPDLTTAECGGLRWWFRPGTDISAGERGMCVEILSSVAARCNGSPPSDPADLAVPVDLLVVAAHNGREFVEASDRDRRAASRSLGAYLAQAVAR